MSGELIGSIGSIVGVGAALYFGLGRMIQSAKQDLGKQMDRQREDVREAARILRDDIRDLRQDIKVMDRRLARLEGSGVAEPVSGD